MNSLIFLLLIYCTILNAADSQLIVMVEKSNIVTVYAIPIDPSTGNFLYGGGKSVYHKSDPDNQVNDLGFVCNGSALETEDKHKYFVNIEYNLKEVQFTKYSTGDGGNAIILPNASGVKSSSACLLNIDETKIISEFVSKRTISSPGKDDVVQDNSEKVSLKIIKIAQQGDAPESRN